MAKDYFEETLRLYHPHNGTPQFVWIYAYKGKIYTDRGTVGEYADRSRVSERKKSKIDAMIFDLEAKGYTEVDENDLRNFDVEFAIADRFATSEELDRRNVLWDKIDEFLALTGQGWTNGVSNGMGTMEIGVTVVDAAIAKETLHKWLIDNGYGDYQQFVDMDR